MTENILEKLFKHNTWANLQIIQACSTLSNEQLDAEPGSATKGSIRLTLWHLVDAEQDYLAQLTRQEPRYNWGAFPGFEELEQAVRLSGEDLLSLAREESGQYLEGQIHSSDGYTFEPWVVVVQLINHATEHREQIKSMLSALGVAPPRVDGWQYGRVKNALIPPPA
jgi:uncharacterized damage-inducible protein DinB